MRSFSSFTVYRNTEDIQFGYQLIEFLLLHLNSMRIIANFQPRDSIVR